MQQLLQTIAFDNVASGAQPTATVDLNINQNLPAIPDIIAFDNPAFDYVSLVGDVLTVINNGADVGDCNVYLIYFHSIQRSFGNAQTKQGTPAPFIIRGAGSGASTGRLLRQPQILDAAAGVPTAYVAPAGCKAIFVEAVGGGGGGGGATFANPNMGFAGGGAGGSCGQSYFEIATTGPAFTYTNGAGGTGGTNVGGNGGQGGSTLFNSDLTGPLMEIDGGAGGQGMVAGAGVATASGGISVPGTAILAQIGFGGSSAGPGIRLSGTVGVSGQGGSSHFGGGGGGRNTQGSGGISGGSNSFGAGAGGSAAVTASIAGQPGMQGGIRVWEFG